jgi:hypothetical protein
MLYTSSIKKAISFAIQVHETDQKQKRKGKDIPYIVHPLGLGLILSRSGASEEVIIAGILHDTLEDSIANKKVTYETLVEEFGKHVADLVLSVTEQRKDLSWEVRKQEALEHVKKFSHGSLLVKSADVINNASELLEDYEKMGDSAFDRFNAPKDKLLKQYASLIGAILEAWPESNLASDLQYIKNGLEKISDPSTSGEQAFGLYLLVENIDKEMLFVQNEMAKLTLSKVYNERAIEDMNTARGYVFDLRDVVVAFAKEYDVYIADVLAYVPEVTMTKEDRIIFINNGLSSIAETLKGLVTYTEKCSEKNTQYAGVLVLLYGCVGDVLKYIQEGKGILQRLV